MTVIRVAIWAALAIAASALSGVAVPHQSSATRTMTAQLEPRDISRRRPTVCTEQYEPVCGRIHGIGKTYSNRCYARADGADIVAQGRCAGPAVQPDRR